MHRRGIVALPAISEANVSRFWVSRSSWGHSLQACSVRALLPRLVHTVGIEERVQCHTCAAELTVERMLFHFIDKQLGQVSLHTTTVYLEHVAPVELAGIISRRSWNL
jgi:hypothetical protein